MRYYPVYFDLNGKEVLVVGGGQVAYRKVRTLVEHGAIVRIVSPEIIKELRAMVDGKTCFWDRKEYTSEDIGSAFIIFSCTQRENINQQVARDAQACCRPVNVVDNPQICSFIVPALLERGHLSIAVSTSGKSPIVARQIRDELEKLYGEEMELYLDMLGEWRKTVKQKLPQDRREKFWAKVTDGEVRDLIKKGLITEAEEVIKSCFQSLSD